VAKQVEDIVVRLVGEGFEALDKIKGSFRELGKVTNLAEKDILSARDSLSEFAKAAGNTEAVSKGLIDAFKGLRSQVDVNSATYRSFSTDIARLETELRGSTAAIDRQRTSLLSNAAAGKENVASLQRQVDALRQLQQETRPGSSAFLQLGKDIDTVTIKLGKLKSEAQAFNLALGQQAGATPEVLNRQIATLQKGLQSVRFDAEQFVETLRKIQLLQITQTGRTGRAGVTADFEAYRSREFTAGYADPSRLAAMPDTTAALNQELSELTKRLDNVSRGGTDYVAVSLRIADIQRQLRTELVGTTEAFRQLDIAQTGADRRAGKLADIQEYYRTQGPTAPGVGGFRDPQTGAMIAAGSRLQTDIRPGTQYDQPIGPQPVNPAFAAFESSMKQSQDRITSIYDDAYVRRTQLQADYNQISIDKLLTGLDMEGQVRNAAFGRELADFDKQLEARDKRRGRRLTGSQLAQGAGAAISGGIFGGPEGLIGGLGGLAVGGVGGAFAGAAAGAQVGMFRQQLAGTADYAASIGKLQIALRGVVRSQAAYDQAIRSAAAATRDLNIPQEEATRGLTRLSAAVIGAGGTVADSSFAFRAMSEAIKATGGNAEQVDGALLALTQVFSKGKVSAEELNQIAERLPGTFTLFAQAAGKTGPELQKALEQGQVGLNDLMKFLELTGDRYGKLALDIAGSSQDAGARLTVAFQAMRLEVGKALQPLGAELQETFTAFIKDITPAVVGSAKAIAAVLSFFTNNEAAGGLARFALQLGAVALAIKGLQAASAGLTALNLASWFTTTAAASKVTSSGMEVAATKTSLFSAAAGGLLSVLSKLAALGVVTVGVTYIERRIKEAGGIQTLAEREGAGGAARQFQGATREVVVAAQVAQRKEAYKQQQRSTRLQKDIAKNSLLYQIPVVSAILAQTFTEQQTRLGYEQRFTQGVLGLDPTKFPAEAPRSEFKLPSDKDTKDKAADKARRDAEAAAAAQQQQNEAIAKAKIALDDAVFRNGMELIRKKYEYEQELEGKKRDLFVRSQTGAARETAGLISGFLGELETLTNRLTEAGQGVETATQELKSAKLMAATTVGSAAATAGIGAATLPGSISGRLDASGQNGADMPVGVNNAIKSYHDGVVKSLGTAGNNGNYIVVNFIDDLGNLLEATYSHVAAMVKVGDPVVGGQTIGRFDASGRTTGPHNSIDINSPGNNGSFQRNRETAAARRSADRLVRGRVQGAAGRQPTGVAAAIAAEGGVSTAEVNLDKAKTLQALAAKQVKDLTAVAGQAFVLDFTDALRQQNAALSDGASITELRNKLQLAGERPETIDAEIRKAEAIQRSTQQTDLAAKALKALDDAGLGGSVAATSLRDGIAAQNAEIAKFKELTDAATASQIAFNEAMRTREDNRIGLGIKEGALAYVESVGTMRDATAQLTQNGIKGLEDQLFSLVTTGKANFQEFAAEILKQSARMILQLTIQRVVMQIIGAIGGGGAPLGFGGAKDPLGAGGAFWKNANGNAFAQNNIVPYAMGGAFTNSVVSKPTLFKFANGGTTRTGLMGEAGPEAIMPLSRGANGKLGVASVGGGGTTNVVVNVDASGNSQVAGDQNQGAQLGRVISQAVQEELIKQRRPGGLLAA
jgi:lambda family phage tail tape measure protein